MSMRDSFRVEGLDALMRDVRQAGGNSKPLVHAALINSVNHTQQQQRSRAAHRTGTLQRSIMGEVHYPWGQVAVNEKYGIYIEEGTGLYGPRRQAITPKTGKVLAFRSGGSMVFAKKVKGMKPRPFFKPGWQAAQPYINAQFGRVADRLLNILGGR